MATKMIRCADYSVIWWPIKQAVNHFCKRYNIKIEAVRYERRGNHYHIWAEDNDED